MNRAAEFLRSRDALLVTALSDCLRATALSNRYTLHPARLAELDREMAGLFLALAEGDPAVDPAARGRRLAEEGLGEDAILALLSAFRRFCQDAVADRSDLAAEAPACAGRTDLILRGYMAGREEMLLRDQEQLRRALSTALDRQGRELLVKNHAIDTSINGIILADMDGTISWVNSSFLSLWGLASAREAVGRKVTEFLTVPEASRALEDLPRTGGWRGEFDAERREGGFSVDVSVSLIRNEEGRAIGVMTSFTDITERRRLQAQVLQAQKMDALGQLAGGITHDFNNLLTAATGYLQLVLRSAPRDPRLQHDLLQVKNALDRGSGLTRQLGLFTRQASGVRQSVSLNDVARETWEIFKRTFPPQITVDLDLAPDLWPIEADPNQMSQVLVNLCVNARDAMTDPEAGSPGGTLRVRTENVHSSEERIGRYMRAPAGRYVLLRVSDTGVGMGPQLLDRLFVPFVTTKAARSGTGLGLAVVYGIVSSHHGFIDVQSAAGRGTEFEVLFPMAAPRAVAAAGTPDAVPLASGHGTVLVVDDDEPVRELMARVLQSCGYRVLSAEEGGGALELFGDGTGIDLVVLDMMMPGMGGRECLVRMRRRNPGARVLITTGYTSGGSARELLREGATGILEKPLDLIEFAAKVQESLRA